MKKLTLALLLCIGSLSVSHAQLNFGAGAQLIFDGSVFGVQGKVLYKNLTDQIDLSGSFTLYLEDGIDWAIDVDAQYQLTETDAGIRLYPFAGVNILKSFANTDIGINLGFGGRMKLTDSLDLYVEPKIILNNGSSLAVTAGVFF